MKRSQKEEKVFATPADDQENVEEDDNTVASEADAEPLEHTEGTTIPSPIPDIKVSSR